MHGIVYRVMEALCAVVARTPVGTHLGLVQLLWMLVSGRLLATRGAVIPGLSATGLPDPAVRRAGAALGHGAWSGDGLLRAWREHVEQAGVWQAHEHEGSQPVAVDVTGFWRPRLGGVRPATPTGRPARRCRRSRSGSSRGWGASGRNGSACRWRWCGRTRPTRAPPRTIGRCS